MIFNENKKKIMMVCPYFYPRRGGVENYVLNISKGLSRDYKWQVVIITSSENKTLYKEEDLEGIKIYRLPYWFKLSNTPINPLWYFGIKKIIDTEKPDIINAHTPVPFISDLSALLAHKYKIPFILTYQNDLTKESQFLNLIIKVYYKLFGIRTGTFADKIITSSDFYARKSFFLKKFIDKVKVVSPGVDLGFYNSIKPGNDLKNRYKRKKIVLFVGQLDRTHAHKGLNILIESLSIVKKSINDLSLVVIGKGDMADNYKIQAKESGIGQSVEIINDADDKMLVRYYKLSDIVVLPSISDSEGFGMVLIEAGACKKPVIGSDIGGIPGVIENMENGILVKPGDPQKLADYIILLLSNTQLAKKLGSTRYKMVMEKFTWEKKVKETHKLLKRY